MSNRVEELESKVAELQAAVNGLTEELVETKERVRLLEEEVEVDLATGTRPVGYGSQTAESAEESPTEAAADPEPESTKETENGSEPAAQAASRRETSAQPADDADFIDADADDPLPSEGAAEDDETKTDESQEDDEAATEDDDIIVA